VLTANVGKSFEPKEPSRRIRVAAHSAGGGDENAAVVDG
jgi:hypothetical protein